MYTLFGTQTMAGMDKMDAQAEAVYAEINAIEQHKPELYEILQVLKQNRESQPALSDSTVLSYKQSLDRLHAIDAGRGQLYSDMYQWNAPWFHFVAWLEGRHPGDYWQVSCYPGEEEPCLTWTKTFKGTLATGGDTSDLWKSAPLGNIQITYGSPHFARSTLEWLRGSILPVLYGALGALVWLLRERYRQVRDRRLRAPVWGEYLQRVLLGAVFGAALGYLNLPSFLPDALANVSLIGLAFIIGYNVEVVFWLFDGMFKAMREKRAEEESERARTRKQAKGTVPTPLPPGARA